MGRSKNTTIKERVTFYAPQTVLEIIDRVKTERNDNSITDAICQIIIEYGTQLQMKRLEKDIDIKFRESLQEITSLKTENEVLKDRLSLLESKCAQLNRTVSEMQTSQNIR